MVFGTKTRQSKVSSTKDHLSKFKSFFKKSKNENSKQVNSLSAADNLSVVCHKVKPFLIVEKVQTAQSEENLSIKNKFRSLFAIKKNDEQSPVVKQRPSRRKRRQFINKIDIFFQEKIYPTFNPSKKMKPIETELEKKQYAVADKNIQIDSQIESIEKLTIEIEQFEKHFQERVRNFNLESNPWDQDKLEVQQEEIDFLNKLIRQKKKERKEQIKLLDVFFAELSSLKENVKEQKKQDDLARVQKIEEEKQRREQLLREQQQQAKETELYKWQLDQIKKQKMRPKEHERLTLHPTELNPWTVQKELQRDHTEQLLAWQERFILLQRTKPSITMLEVKNGIVPLSELHPHEIKYAQEYEEKSYRMLLEMKHIIQQQRQEKIQLERDTVTYIKAFWDTKSKQMVRDIKDSGVAQQLMLFNKKIGICITNLCHKII